MLRRPGGTNNCYDHSYHYRKLFIPHILQCHIILLLQFIKSPQKGKRGKQRGVARDRGIGIRPSYVAK